jgi:hypothetical protein
MNREKLAGRRRVPNVGRVLNLDWATYKVQGKNSEDEDDDENENENEIGAWNRKNNFFRIFFLFQYQPGKAGETRTVLRSTSVRGLFHFELLPRVEKFTLTA